MGRMPRKLTAIGLALALLAVGTTAAAKKKGK